MHIKLYLDMGFPEVRARPILYAKLPKVLLRTIKALDLPPKEKQILEDTSSSHVWSQEIEALAYSTRLATATRVAMLLTEELSTLYLWLIGSSAKLSNQPCEQFPCDLGFISSAMAPGASQQLLPQARISPAVALSHELKKCCDELVWPNN